MMCGPDMTHLNKVSGHLHVAFFPKSPVGVSYRLDALLGEVLVLLLRAPWIQERSV